MHVRLIALVLAVAAMATAGCGAGTGTTGETTPTTRTGGIEHPSGRTDVVLRVRTGGGFTTIENALRIVPEFTLYGDGTVIVPGPVDAVFPGPALLPLRTFRLSDEQMEQLLEKARHAGLLRMHGTLGDMGTVGVSDMPSTEVWLNAGGRHVHVSAYALGAGSGQGLTAAQRAARASLQSFISGLPQQTGSELTPSALTVFVSAAPPGAGGRRPVRWPLSTPPHGSSFGEGLPYTCVAVTGGDVPPMLRALSAATSISPWVASGEDGRFGLVARPVLPDQTACGDPAL